MPKKQEKGRKLRIVDKKEVDIPPSDPAINAYLDRMQELLLGYAEQAQLSDYVPDNSLPVFLRLIHPVPFIAKGLEYFRLCLAQRQRPALFGLTLFLGLPLKAMDYLEKKYDPQFGDCPTEAFVYPIMLFKGYVALFAELSGQACLGSPTFDMFMLKHLGLNEQEKNRQAQAPDTPLFDEQQRLAARERLNNIKVVTVEKEKPLEN